jgi:hypothetical protein
MSMLSDSLVSTGRVLRTVAMKDTLQLWRVVANTLNMQLRTADEERYAILRIVRRINTHRTIQRLAHVLQTLLHGDGRVM